MGVDAYVEKWCGVVYTLLEESGFLSCVGVRQRHQAERWPSQPPPLSWLQNVGVRQASNLLPRHQPQEISAVRLTKALLCLRSGSDGK
jgi:hypothetical protein